MICQRFSEASRRVESGRGRFDRFQRRLLTCRDVVVLAYMAPHHWNWIKTYPSVVVANTVAFAVSCLPISPAGPGLAISLLVLLTGSLIYLYTRGGWWIGFSAPQFGGAIVPQFALLPLGGFDEISRDMWKVAVIRAGWVLPLALLPATTFALKFEGPWWAWALGAFAIVSLYLAAQGWIMGATFAETMSWPTERNRSLHWWIARALSSLPGVLLTGFVSFFTTAMTLGLLGDAGVLTESSIVPVACVLLVLFALSSTGAWRLVRAMYRLGIVDLVRSRPSMGQQGMLR